jgi:Ser/Thr protein kinase RdoA (MazF antagonist)
MQARPGRVYNGGVEKAPPLNAAAGLFGLTPSDLQPLRGGHVSHVYGFDRDGCPYILRLSPPEADLDLAAQRAILAWMRFLAKHGACVPKPVPSTAGNLIETFSQEDGEWQAIVLTRAQGVLSEELSLVQWDAALFEALGRAVGKLHVVAGEYDPPEDVRRPDWDAGGNLFRCPKFDQPFLAEKAASTLERIRGLPRGPESYGLIHADLHFGNFYVDVPSRSITIFDFDDCCYGWYAMDLAILLFDVLVLYSGADRDSFARDFMRSLLKGYRQERAIDLSGMAEFAKLLEINLFGSIAPDYVPGKGWWGDRFMPGRRERIEQDQPYTRLDFARL